MNQYELQPTIPEPISDPATATEPADDWAGLQLADSTPVRSSPPSDVASLGRMLAILQRQQGEQTRLLRQLLQEVETLKAAQNQQGTTVTKLDRRMRRARFFRISWLIIRTVVFAAGIGFIIYIIGVDQIQAMWERLVWFFT